MSDFNTNILIPPDYTTPTGSDPTSTLTLKQWNLVYARVRDWQYDYSGSFAVTGVVRSATSTVVANTLSEGLSDELDIISPGHSGFSGLNGVNYVYDDASTTSDGSGVSFGFSYDLVGLDLAITSFFNLITPGGFASGTVNIRYPLAWSGSAYSTIKATCTGSVSVTNANGTGKDISGSFSLTIVPKLFWGWGGKFDTTTGAPIP